MASLSRFSKVPGGFLDQARKILTKRMLSVYSVFAHDDERHATVLNAAQANRRRNFSVAADNFVDGPKYHQYQGETTVIVDGIARQFNTTWLRENCRCPSCYNSHMQQRIVAFHRLQHTAFKVEKLTLSPDNQAIGVSWADGHASMFGVEWLKQNAYPGPPSNITKKLWNAKMLALTDLEKVDFRQLVSGEDNEKATKTLLTNLLRLGFSIVENTPTSMEATKAACEAVCFLQRTFYGIHWHFGSKVADERGLLDRSFHDTAYTSEALGAHNDGTYFKFPPGIQVLHCLEHTGSGGENLLVDGFNAAETLRRYEPEAFDILTKTRLDHVFLEPSLSYHSQTVILKVLPATGALEWIRYNPYDRAPISTLPQTELASIYEAIACLGRIIDDSENEFWLKLNPGTILLFDNWRLLHGRANYTGSRQMCGCYLPRDDWISKARILGLYSN